MDTVPKSFLEELRNLEEPTKTKVLIVTTVILMVIVLYFWLAYFNGIVSGPAQATMLDRGQASATIAETSPNPSFWSKVGNGTAVVGQTIGGGIQWLGRAFESPREYVVKPQ
jgi:hypothetical protein